MHEKISRDLSLASPRLDALTDLTDVPELLTLGAMPQYEARWSWSGNLPMSTDTASCARGAAGGEAGQVGDPEPRGAGPPHGEGPYVAELVDDDERAGGRGGEQRVELGLPVADGGAVQHLPVAVDQAGPVR